MINLDPALLDQDAIRLKRRKRLLLITLVPVLVLVIAALFFARTTIYNIMLSANNNSALYKNVATVTDIQKIGNIIEPYIAYYNGGTIKLVEAKTEDDLIGAEEEFKESLKQNPPEEALCSIYGNYSYAVELGADYKVKNKDYDGSLVEYNRAKALLYENGCADRGDQGNGSDKKAEEAVDRIDSKYRKAVASANQLENPEEGGDEGSGANQQLTESEIEEWQKEQSDASNKSLRGLIQYRMYDYNKSNPREYSYSTPGF